MSAGGVCIMRRPFWKMHGAGNDFVLLDGDQQPMPTASDVQRMAHRRMGVGCDQLIVLQTQSLIAPQSAHASKSLQLHFFNADGSKAEACGNGTRCAAHWYMTRHRVSQVNITVGTRQLLVQQCNEQIWVNMGPADFSPTAVGMTLPHDRADEGALLTLLSLETLPLHHAMVVSMGNPHLVLYLSTPPDEAMVREHGARLETHPLFAHRANIGFVWQQDDQWYLRVWERGVGETLACGSGACAAFIALRHYGALTANSATLSLPGGALALSQHENDIWLSGPVVTSYTGEWHG